MLDGMQRGMKVEGGIKVAKQLTFKQEAILGYSSEGP